MPNFSEGCHSQSGRIDREGHYFQIFRAVIDVHGVALAPFRSIVRAVMRRYNDGVAAQGDPSAVIDFLTGVIGYDFLFLLPYSVRTHKRICGPRARFTLIARLGAYDDTVPCHGNAKSELVGFLRVAGTQLRLLFPSTAVANKYVGGAGIFSSVRIG